MRTTIRLNSELTRRAKKYAAQQQMTFTDVVEEAITKLLAIDSKTSKPKKRIILPTFGDPKRRITEKQYRAAIEQMYEEEAEHIRRGSK